MIKAIFFDWFNTLARYEPPREELHSQLLREFGIEVSPHDLLPGILAGDKYFFTEGARSPISKLSREEMAELYTRYADVMLSEVGIKADKELLLQIISRWPELFKGARFVLFDDVLTTLQALKEQNFILGLLTNATKNLG